MPQEMKYILKQRMLEDIFTYLRREGIVKNKQDFAQKINMAGPNLSQAFSGNKSYLTDNLFIYKIGDAFPDMFNLEWLRTGRGEMLKKNSDQHIINASGGTNVQAEGNAKVILPVDNKEQLAMIVELKAEVAALKSENETLKNENTWLRSVVYLAQEKKQ